MLREPEAIDRSAVDFFKGGDLLVGQREGLSFDELQHPHPPHLFGHHMVLDTSRPVAVRRRLAIEWLDIARRFLVHVPLLRVKRAIWDLEEAWPE